MGNLRTFCCLVVLAACGKEENFPVRPDLPDAAPPTDGSGSDGQGSDGGSDAGLDAAAGDVDPPVITLVTPEAGTLLNGTFTLEVNVQDASPIAELTATIAGTTSITMNPVVGTTRFRGSVNTVPLAGLVAPVIVVRAKDAGGLEGELGFTVTLDNEGPVSSFDPANVRLFKIEQSQRVCSDDFDPVGSDAPNDGETVPQLFELRARVVDVPNTGTIDPTTSLFFPKAGVKSVELYVLDDTTIPLVVDTDGDGLCDDINPDVVPASVPVFANEAAVVQMVAIEPKGTAFFGSTPMGGTNLTDCTTGEDLESPDNLCDGEISSTVVIEDDDQSQIFGLAPVSDANCTGFVFDASASNISNGFACVATLTVDNLGNRRVSEPLRICINAAGGTCNGVAVGNVSPAGQRPDCTGTVTGGNTTTTACVPKRFFRTATQGLAEFELVPQ